MPFPIDFLRRCGALAVAAGLFAVLAGCSEDSSEIVDRAYRPVSPEMLALMQEKGTTDSAPVLFRTYKKEAEFEIWKMRADGRYALLKTYPMCRWSGQLGPKTKQGDRQVPEGFYAIYPSQMNPHSDYYLSFNVGYPNLYDRVHGYTGDSIMVHGICSSAGCFSMTDPQIAEIYAIARDAFSSGQQEIQMQSMPFHMTAENFAKYRLDPNIAFWRELKNGADNFEVTKQEVAVGVCNEHYVFNAKPADGGSLDPTAPCPALKRDEMVHDEVVAKEARDDARITELVASGVQPVHTVYADGGQNPVFTAKVADVSRPEALAAGPVDVAIKKHAKAPTQAQLKAARAKDLAAAEAADKKAKQLRMARGEADPDAAPVAAAAQPAPPPVKADAGGDSIFTRLFTPKSQAPQQAPATAQATADAQATNSSASAVPAQPAAAAVDAAPAAQSAAPAAAH